MTRSGLALSHVGLWVHDLERMEDFYTRVLGFTVTDRGQLPGPSGPVDLVFTSRDPDEHHQIVLARGRPAKLGFNVINQLSLKADSLSTLREMHRRLVAEKVRDLIPVTHGNAISVYGLDPEGTRLELFIDTPWYVLQPLRVALDCSLDDEALMRRVEAHARSLPGFKPRSEWRAEMARRMGVP
ncbi:MAG: VOC family protein [Steroidobacteraceae bacterium]|jgi:catechol 2,3-dioxygenase-like lactoylglutathione lyase family enzyme